MRREALLELVERLGQEFRRRGMDEHLRPLRVYYLALLHRLTAGKLEVSWSAQHTVEWLQALRLPPYQDFLPVRPPGAPCPKCGKKKAGGMEATLAAVRRLEFPGGARNECLGCGERWLEEAPLEQEGTPDAERALQLDRAADFKARAPLPRFDRNGTGRPALAPRGTKKG